MSMILSAPGKAWRTMSSFGTSACMDAAKDCRTVKEAWNRHLWPIRAIRTRSNYCTKSAEEPHFPCRLTTDAKPLSNKT
jgi:hypothetical protein